MISFCVLNICRQCLKSDRLGKTFPPHGSFKILNKYHFSIFWRSLKLIHTYKFLDHPNKNIPKFLFPNQQINNRKNEMYVHQDHVEQHEIFQVNNHKLSLYKKQIFLIKHWINNIPPTIRPVSVKFNWRYFPKRLEFWFIHVWALPNASSNGDVYNWNNDLN